MPHSPRSLPARMIHVADGDTVAGNLHVPLSKASCQKLHERRGAPDAREIPAVLSLALFQDYNDVLPLNGCSVEELSGEGDDEHVAIVHVPQGRHQFLRIKFQVEIQRPSGPRSVQPEASVSPCRGVMEGVATSSRALPIAGIPCSLTETRLMVLTFKSIVARLSCSYQLPSRRGRTRTSWGKVVTTASTAIRIRMKGSVTRAYSSTLRSAI